MYLWTLHDWVKYTVKSWSAWSAGAGSQNIAFDQEKQIDKGWNQAKKAVNNTCAAWHSLKYSPDIPQIHCLPLHTKTQFIAFPISPRKKIYARPKQACVKSKGIKHTEGRFTYHNANYISCEP